MRVWSTQLNMELMPLFANAAASTEIPDHIGVDALCRRLTGVKSIKFADVAADLARLEMPRGFMHVRLFDEADMTEFTSSFSTTGRPISPSMIATLIMIHPRFMTDEWLATTAVVDNPHEAPGVLDLMVRFRPRGQSLEFFDID